MGGGGGHGGRDAKKSNKNKFESTKLNSHLLGEWTIVVILSDPSFKEGKTLVPLKPLSDQYFERERRLTRAYCFCELLHCFYAH